MKILIESLSFSISITTLIAMKLFKKIGLSLAAILLIAAIFLYPKYKNVNHAIHLFDKEQITSNFRTMNDFWPSSTLTQAGQPFVYPRKDQVSLPAEFKYNNEVLNTKTFIDSSFTTGLIIIQDDTIVYENYFLGFDESTTTISWSVAKSFISALFGIAVEEGLIKSIEENVEVYVPELVGSSYEGVKIEDVLQMSTGVKFNEDYGDFNSDINRWGRGFALGRSQDKFAASLERVEEPGTYHHYVSINTHVLGMILVRATGQSITEYMQEKLWTPAGMEFDAHWLLDGNGMEMALGGLNATLRDYAKIGSIFLNNGFWNGKQIVPKDWIAASTTPDAPHLMPGPNAKSAHPLGYGYQWWIPEGDQGEFIALGIYNQQIYINPSTKTVIAKTSANPNFNDKSRAPSTTEAHIELYRHLIKSTLVPQKQISQLQMN